MDFVRGWPTVEEARDAMAEETGTPWHIRDRAKTSHGQRIVLRCTGNMVHKCRAKIVLIQDLRDGKNFQVNSKHTVLVHNDHVPGPVKRVRVDDSPAVVNDGVTLGPAKRVRFADLPAVEDKEVDDGDDDDGETLIPYPDHVVEARLASIEGLNCEEIRCQYMSELNGLRFDAHTNLMYRLEGFRSEYCRRSLFKRVTLIESAALFGQALREHERPYFEWWSMFNAGEQTSPLVFLRVHGASSLEVQRSLMRMQKRYACLTRADFRNSGHTRHAVFTCPVDPMRSALLAINMHALRSYRMLSLDDLRTNSSMPMAPVLMQCWGLRPSTQLEITSRRFGIMATILFLRDVLGHGRADFERSGYGVMEPGFEIYDVLPDFLAMFHDTEPLLRFRSRPIPSQCTACSPSAPRRPHRLYQSMQSKDPHQCTLTNLIAAFLFQKHAHFASNLLVQRLYEHFSDGPRSIQLQERCPDAWRIIRSTKANSTGKDWVLLDLTRKQKQGAKQKRLAMPPSFYLYRLALVDGRELLPYQLRWDICTHIIVQNVYQPAFEFRKSVMYPDTMALEYYHQSMPRASEDPVATRLRVFSLNKHHLWPLASLFHVLRALDYHRQRAPVPRVMLDDMEPAIDLNVVDGPVHVQDPLDYALSYVNLPVAYKVRGEVLPDPESEDLAYLDDTLWVWGSGLRREPTPLEEAELLVRDPIFYGWG